MSAKFGPAGNSDSFYAAGYKHTWQGMEYIAEMGLDAYEYQAGNGVRTGEAAAKKIAAEAKRHGIEMSVHSPYFINLSSPEEDRIKSNIGYIVQSAELVKNLGGRRVVVHSGAVGKMAREEALEHAKRTVALALLELDARGLSDTVICLETMGKINQLGSLEEVLKLCVTDERLLPVIDFGHLNARTHGEIKGGPQYAKILDAIYDALGSDRVKNFHIHFSKIEYTAGGEKRHLTFEDTLYGPDFEPLTELLAKRGLSPVVICESRGTQAEDALAMKQSYQKYRTEALA